MASKKTVSKTQPKTTSEEMNTLATPPVEVTPATPVVKKASKSKKVAPVEPVVQEVVPVVEKVSSEPVEMETENVKSSEEDDKFLFDIDDGDFVESLKQITTLLNGLKTKYNEVRKKQMKKLKECQKLTSKKKKKNGNKAPSGFVKPTKISDELTAFLGKEHGVEMARTAVTSEINAYIRANSLQDKTNGRIILPDEKLATLLKIKDGEQLTYFNLQKFMSPHFTKSVPVVPETSMVA